MLKTLISLKKSKLESRETSLNNILKEIVWKKKFWHQVNLSSAITRVLQNSTHCLEYKREDLLSTKNSGSYMNGQYVAWIEPSLLFGYNDKMSGIRLFLDRSCAVCLWDRCPTRFARVQWCNCANVVSNQRKGCIRLRHRHQGHPQQKSLLPNCR